MVATCLLGLMAPSLDTHDVFPQAGRRGTTQMEMMSTSTVEMQQGRGRNVYHMNSVLLLDEVKGHP